MDATHPDTGPQPDGGGRGGSTAAVLPDYLADALVAIQAAVGELLTARSAALTGPQARALTRQVDAASAQLYGAQLHTLRVLADHPDALTPTMTPANSAPEVTAARVRGRVKTFLTSGLHADPVHAARDVAAAALLAPDTGDLPAVAAALAEGAIGADAVTIAVRTHRALGATVRDRVDAEGNR